MGTLVRQGRVRALAASPAVPVALRVTTRGGWLAVWATTAGAHLAVRLDDVPATEAPTLDFLRLPILYMTFGSKRSRIPVIHLERDLLP